MKIINTILDSYYNIYSYLYQLPSGLRILHTYNKNSVDFKISIVFKAAMLLEDQIGVPRGTAHFLEHLIFQSPNKYFKNRVEMDKYSFGNTKRPAFWSNASTGYKFTSFIAYGHKKGYKRMFKLLSSQLNYDEKLIFNEKEIEKQRSIIISELKRKLKEDMDPGVLYDKLFLGSNNPLLVERTIGTYESVSSITKEHLQLFLKSFYSPKNVVLGIESNSKLTKEVESQIQNLDRILLSYNNDFNHDYNFNPLDFSFRYGHFKDIHRQDVFCSFNLFYKNNPTSEINYKESAHKTVLLDFIGNVMHEYLREEKMLIYGVKTFTESVFTGVLNKGFTFNVPKEKLLETFNAIEFVITNFAKTFLESAQGEEQFESIKSKYIFKRDVSLPSSYNEDRCRDVLDNYFMNNDQDLFEKEILKMTKKDLLKTFSTHFKSIAGIWLVSPFEDSETLGIFESSNLFKYFKKIHS